MVKAIGGLYMMPSDTGVMLPKIHPSSCIEGHAGDRGLIAAPWTPASLSLLPAMKTSTEPEAARLNRFRDVLQKG
jgi:hypothetical protein